MGWRYAGDLAWERMAEEPTPEKPSQMVPA